MSADLFGDVQSCGIGKVGLRYGVGMKHMITLESLEFILFVMYYTSIHLSCMEIVVLLKKLKPFAKAIYKTNLLSINYFCEF